MVLIAYLLSTSRVIGQGPLRWPLVKPWVVLGEKHYRAFMSEMPLSLDFPISGAASSTQQFWGGLSYTGLLSLYCSGALLSKVTH